MHAKLEASAPHVTLADMRQLVALDRVGMKTFRLTHCLTNETVALPGGEYELCFAEDGLGCVLLHLDATDDDGEVLVTDIRQYLKSEIYTDASGERYVLTFQDGQLKQHESFDNALTGYRDGRVTINVGGTDACASIDVFIFKHTRPLKMRLMWDVLRLYGFLGLDTFSGRRSKWAFASLSRWKKLMNTMFGPNTKCW